VRSTVVIRVLYLYPLRAYLHLYIRRHQPWSDIHYCIIDIESVKQRQASMLSLESIFSSSKFADESFNRPRWWTEGSFFTTLRKVKSPAQSKEKEAVAEASDLTATTSSAAAAGQQLNEIMWHSAETGVAEPLVTLSQLIPPGQGQGQEPRAPLGIDDYSTSKDRSKVLIFTESQRVWRVNTRGSYWVLDLSPGVSAEQRLVRLGESFPNKQGLMFASFSPDASKVAYVYENNIYAEDLSSHEITALTSDGSVDVINGTFDWVYEEEFHMYCGFRWSPDGASIAYWQLDQSDVPIVNLINNTDR
jgi:dipeptidyl-peptidase-4